MPRLGIGIMGGGEGGGYEYDGVTDHGIMGSAAHLTLTLGLAGVLARADL